MNTKNITRTETLGNQRFYLKALEESGAQTIPLNDLNFIGREAANDISLADPFISRRHAKIERKDSYFAIQDLQSQNGIYINGVRTKEAYLSLGDRIRLGQKEFIFTNTFQTKNPAYHLESKNADFQKQLESLPNLAQTDLSVLLQGESGCGKEIIARYIHEHSPRRFSPFLSLNCSAFTASMIESELFGHKKGSFTDASQDRKGAFEAARGGTLVLDEVGDLPLDLQPKLLRALENKEIRPVGSDQTIKTDVRIIASTHKSLRELVQKNLFRADLYYRLNVIQFELPPLRRRMQDFEGLLYDFAREMRVSFSHNAIQALKEYTWPGNIRELKNMVARASAIYGNGEVVPENISQLVERYYIETNLEKKPGSMPLLKGIEIDLIKDRLSANNGNQRRTAEELGIPKSTLYDRIRTYKIDVKEFRASE